MITITTCKFNDRNKKLGIKGQKKLHVVAENVISRYHKLNTYMPDFQLYFLNYISEKQYPKVCFIIKKVLIFTSFPLCLCKPLYRENLQIINFYLEKKKQENFASTKNYRLDIVNQACMYVTLNVWLIEITSTVPLKQKTCF